MIMSFSWVCSIRLDFLERVFGILWEGFKNEEKELYASHEGRYVSLWSPTRRERNVPRINSHLFKWVWQICNTHLQIILICNIHEFISREEVDSICMVTPWNEWTSCSVICGEGERTRSRRYMNHMGRKKCNVELTQSERCRGPVKMCDPTTTPATSVQKCFTYIHICIHIVYIIKILF